jgi:hypothetical protein
MALHQEYEHLQRRVGALKETIAANDGTNAADSRFARSVDEIISWFYDDIAQVRALPARALFDLFLIKTLYVERRSRDYAALDYLGDLLHRYLFVSELFPIVKEGRQLPVYITDILEEAQRQQHFQNMFEAYRKFGDNALFVTGILARSLTRRRSGAYRGYRAVPFVLDAGYYITSGKRYYRLAAEHPLAGETDMRDTLNRLAHYFEVYMDALAEVGDRYVHGFDLELIADKMLDAFNRYRKTGEQRYLENARRYAAILKIDPTTFPGRWKARGVAIGGPPA